MTMDSSLVARTEAAPYKLITGMFPDDGRAHELLEDLRTEKSVITANVFQCRGVGITDRPRRFRRPPPSRLVQVMMIMITGDRADEIFEYVHDRMEVDLPNRGFLYQVSLTAAHPYLLPEDIEDEDPSAVKIFGPMG